MIETIQSDVMVCGGGPAGIGAAVAAARLGRQVTLVERHPMLGGMGTAALVNNFCPAHFDRERFIIGGIFAELRDRLIAREALYAIRPTDTVHPRMEPYDPDVFAEEALTFCRDAGVDVLLERRVANADFQPAHACAVTFDDGTQRKATVVVDATGDAEIAAAAGVPCLFGEDGTQAVMPLSLCYLMGPIDLDAAQREFPESLSYDPNLDEHYFYYTGSNPRVLAWVADARRSGELSIPVKGIAAIMSLPGRPWIAMVNFGRVDIQDPTDPRLLADATDAGRRQVEEGIRFFRKHMPGMDRVELVQLAHRIGVRESRRIVGRYTLTGGDVRAGRQFDDCIAQCCYAIDVHHKGRDTTLLEPFTRGRHFDIPWRSLVPIAGPPNLVVAGRSIGAEREAMSSFRVSPSCMAIGQAAGAGAALALQSGGVIGDVDYDDLRRVLLEQGAIIA